MTLTGMTGPPVDGPADEQAANAGGSDAAQRLERLLSANRAIVRELYLRMVQQRIVADRGPAAIRMPRTSDDPRSSGFLPMDTFLGVPILALASAASAGIAIENARLYEESARRGEWLQACAASCAGGSGPDCSRPA